MFGLDISNLEIGLIIFALISEYLGLDDKVKPNGITPFLGGFIRDIFGRIKDN